MRRLALPLLAVLVLAGCVDPAATLETQETGPADAPAPGCDPTRSAVAHRAGGVPVADAAGPAPVPCAIEAGVGLGEPTMGVCPETGDLFYYPSLKNSPPQSPIAMLRSQDEGASWTVHAASVAGVDTHRFTLDGYVYVDPATCRVFLDDLVTANCSAFSFSDDAGETWTNSVAGCLEFDHQTVFAGPPVLSATVSYPNVVYRCAINAVALAGASTAATCMKSLDGGLTFIPTGSPSYVTDPGRGGYGNVPGYCDGAHGHGVADSKGVIYVPKGFCGQPFLAISRDEGLTWERVQVSDLGMPMGSAGEQDHEAGVAVDAEGNVYYAWVANDRLPYLAVSRDGGKTWGTPLAIGPPGLTEASLAEIAVGGVGKVAVAYMGSENSKREFGSLDCRADLVQCAKNVTGLEQPTPDDNKTWNGYVTISVDALSDDPLFWSAPVNDPADPLVRGECGPIRCQQVYDFLDVVIGPDGTPWAAFADGCSQKCAAGAPGDQNVALVGRLFAGPSLLDEAPSDAGAEGAARPR